MMGERANLFHKLMLRLFALTPGVYWLTLVVDEHGVKWSVQPAGKLEG